MQSDADGMTSVYIWVRETFDGLIKTFAAIICLVIIIRISKKADACEISSLPFVLLKKRSNRNAFWPPKPQSPYKSLVREPKNFIPLPALILETSSFKEVKFFNNFKIKVTPNETFQRISDWIYFWNFKIIISFSDGEAQWWGSCTWGKDQEVVSGRRKDPPDQWRAGETTKVSLITDLRKRKVTIPWCRWCRLLQLFSECRLRKKLNL